MKLALATALVLASFQAFAATPQVDCSQAAKGKVTIKVDGDQIEQSAAAKLAFSCFARLPNNIKAINAMVKKAADDAGANQSNCSLGKVSVLETSSWNAERAYGSIDDKTQKVNYSTGGESTQLATQSYFCGGVGTGLYSGNVALIGLKMSVINSVNLGDIEADDAKTSQTLEISNPKFVNLLK